VVLFWQEMLFWVDRPFTMLQFSTSVLELPLALCSKNQVVLLLIVDGDLLKFLEPVCVAKISYSNLLNTKRKLKVSI
jgi:hypothetical protein